MMRKEFSKTFDTKALGQIVVIKMVDQEHPQVRFYFGDILGNAITFSVVSQNTDTGHELADSLFDRMDIDTAMMFVKSYLSIPLTEIMQ